MSEIYKRLVENKVPAVLDTSRLVSLAEHQPVQEKVLADIFFTLGLGLSKMSQLNIAHLDLRAENIFLDENLNPYFAGLDFCIEFGEPEHIQKDLMDFCAVMKDVISFETPAWVEDITHSRALIDLRRSLFALAEKGSTGQLANADELIGSLIDIYPELLNESSPYFLPPAEVLEELPVGEINSADSAGSEPAQPPPG